MIPMKKYVGNANSFPDSLTPRRFPKAMIATKPSARNTLYGARTGMADVERVGSRRSRDRHGEDVVGEQ